MKHNGNITLVGASVIENLRLEQLADDKVGALDGTAWYNTSEKKVKVAVDGAVLALATGGNLDLVAAEVDAVEAAVGLNADGSLQAFTGTNYLNAAGTIRQGLTALDTQVKANADAAAAASDAASAAQSEIDAVEAAVGLGTNGSYAAPAGNYLAGSTLLQSLQALDTQVKANSDALPTKFDKAGGTITGDTTFQGNVTVETGKAISIADLPTQANHAVNKGYVDSKLAGLSWKAPVLAIRADHTAYASALVVGDRILNTTDDKVYTVTADGADGAAATFDAGTIANANDAFFVKESDSGYTFDEETSSWVQFTGTGQINAGNGMTKSGNTLNVVVGDGLTAGADLIDVVLDGATLTKSATGIKVADQGIDAAQLAAGVIGNGLQGAAGQAITVKSTNGIEVTAAGVGVKVKDAGGVLVAATGIELDFVALSAKYLDKDATSEQALAGPLALAGAPTADLHAATKLYVDELATKVAAGQFLYSGASAATSHTVTHNLGQQYPQVTVVDANDNVVIPQSIKFDTANQLTVTFASAVTCKVSVTAPKA